MMDLRPYQIESQDRIRDGWKSYQKQILVLPTGAGKTIVAANVAKEHVLAGGCVLFLAHRKELLDQTIDKFGRAVGLKCELEKAEFHASEQSSCVVGSLQTFTSRGYRWNPDHFSMIIIDECHHSASDSYQNVIKMFPAAKVLGITATPYRSDQRELGDTFESIAHEVKLFDLIKDGYLSRITIKSIPVAINLSNCGQMKGDFRDDDLGETIEPYLEEVAKAIMDHAIDKDQFPRRTLVFVPLIHTSKKFVQICRDFGLMAAHIDGESPDRDQIQRDFRAGKYDLLSNAMLLTEGYDDPGINCIVILRPTRSNVLYSQMVGRGTRIHPGKDDLLLLDLLWMHERMKLVRPANLIATGQDEADRITELAEEKAKQGGESQMPLDLEDLASEAAMQREAKLRKTLEEHKHKKAKTISADDYLVEHDRLDLAEYEPAMPWERQDMSDAQRWTLKRAGIDVSTVRGKGHASQLIGIIKKQETLTLASQSQREIMRRAGHPNWSTATTSEARQFFAGLKQRKNHKREEESVLL